MKWWRTFYALMASGLVGCAGPAPATSTVPVETLYAATQCGALDVEASATYIADEPTFRRLYAAARRAVLNADAGPPAVDFSRHVALMVSMGTQPTAGYALSLAQVPARLVGATLEITLDWRAPPRDALVAQMLTSPCIFLRIPGTGFESVRIRDGAGRIRLSVPVR